MIGARTPKLSHSRVEAHCLGIVTVAVNFHNAYARRRWSASAMSHVTARRLWVAAVEKLTLMKE